jgi:hypothetical protein
MLNTMIDAEYLGDGVYVQVQEQDGSVVLTTGAHFDSGRYDNRVYLEPGVLATFLRYLEKRRSAASGAKQAG